MPPRGRPARRRAVRPAMRRRCGRRRREHPGGASSAGALFRGGASCGPGRRRPPWTARTPASSYGAACPRRRPGRSAPCARRRTRKETTTRLRSRRGQAPPGTPRRLPTVRPAIAGRARWPPGWGPTASRHEPELAGAREELVEARERVEAVPLAKALLQLHLAVAQDGRAHQDGIHPGCGHDAEAVRIPEDPVEGLDDKPARANCLGDGVTGRVRGARGHVSDRGREDGEVHLGDVGEVACGPVDDDAAQPLCLRGHGEDVADERLGALGDVDDVQNGSGWRGGEGLQAWQHVVVRLHRERRPADVGRGRPGTQRQVEYRDYVARGVGELCHADLAEACRDSGGRPGSAAQFGGGVVRHCTAPRARPCRLSYMPASVKKVSGSCLVTSTWTSSIVSTSMRSFTKENELTSPWSNRLSCSPIEAALTAWPAAVAPSAR